MRQSPAGTATILRCFFVLSFSRRGREFGAFFRYQMSLKAKVFPVVKQVQNGSNVTAVVESPNDGARVFSSPRVGRAPQERTPDRRRRGRRITAARAGRKGCRTPPLPAGTLALLLPSSRDSDPGARASLACRSLLQFTKVCSSSKLTCVFSETKVFVSFPTPSRPRTQLLSIKSNNYLFFLFS
jgi:hypothetical protein